MRDVWRRWRRYFQQLDDVLRVCGRQLEETERDLKLEFDVEHWRRVQQDAAERELVRRAHEEPFFRSLIRAARRWPDAENEGSAGHSYQPYPEDVSIVVQASGETSHTELSSDPDESGDDKPPVRILAAERAIRRRTRSLSVLVERLVNPHNAAAITRSAEFLGLQEIHLVQKEGVSRMSRSITRSCEKYVDRFWYKDSKAAVHALRERGSRIWVADVGGGSIPLGEVPVSDSMVIALGSERRGVSQELLSLADGTFHIPGAGFTAYLNVSTTAAIALRDLDYRQRLDGCRKPLSEEDRMKLRQAWFPELARGNRWREQEFTRWITRAANWGQV